MKQKKHTVNERLALLERAFELLVGELNAVIKAINMTVKEPE